MATIPTMLGSQARESNACRRKASMALTLLNVARLGGLGLDLLFELFGRSEIDGSTLREVTAQGRWVAPVNLPTMVDCDENVLYGRNAGDVEAAVGVRLVLANGGKGTWVTERGGNEENSGSDGGLVVQGNISSESGETGGHMQCQGRVTRADGDVTAMNVGRLSSDCGEIGVGAAGEESDLILTGRDFDDTTFTGSWAIWRRTP